MSWILNFIEFKFGFILSKLNYNLLEVFIKIYIRNSIVV
jgi:hypothetical protein